MPTNYCDTILNKYLGKVVTATIDRPLGHAHPNYPDMIYPINYGYIEGIFAADGEEQDVYVLGVSEPLTTFTGVVIAAIRREDDVEDKWVAAPEGMRFSSEEIAEAVHFGEQFFDSRVYVNIS